MRTGGYLPLAMPLRQTRPLPEAKFQDPKFQVPFDRDLKFVGRKDVIQNIDNKFKANRRVALFGIGGIG